ncbi:amino acid deaminase [Aquitalea magnusonii]|uniref:D-serine dehydratase n=1 Tax=Aquitalea magnusonii TaxID=332411 RepID=A0A318IY48_9NEIS|nr:amino acid deaminase [Aquitalea magnusonii]PXX39873.1 D-serine dehydratase [Aquitalea magnusonii]
MPQQEHAAHMLNRATKGLGASPASCTLQQVAQLGWNILREDVSLPVALLRQSRIEHNLQWMQQFMQRYGVELAPHGKTTMSPQLFHMQLAHGAWGITLATAPQVQAAYQHGIRRFLLANQLVGKANMAIIARLQQADPDFSFCCIVDSAANVDALGQFFAQNGQTLRILLEYGVEGGRTGVRTPQQENEVLAAIARWPQSLSLIGVEIYEGVLQQEEDIRAFLRKVVARTREHAARKLFREEKILLSGAGSAWYDVVADEFSGLDLGQPLQVLLRPGCYLTHDVGIYLHAEQRIQSHNPVAREMGRTLQPALQLWAYVQSIPESGRAIIGLGKRDAAFDAGLPQVSLHFRPGRSTVPQPAPADWIVSAMMDQHAFMRIPADADLQVGDMLAFEISHPCLTFDKWRQLLLVDDALNVTGAVETLF